jgi:hypothetical protein
MAILFSAKKKREMYLISICLFLFLALGLFWMNFLFFGKDSKEKAIVSPYILEEEEKDIEIGLEKLEGQVLEELQFFQSIVATQQRIGRENPFAPVLPPEAAED